MHQQIRRGGLAVALLLAPAAAAHDMWIVPPGAGLEAGDLVAVRLRVGHGGTDEPVLRDARRIVRFTAGGAGGELPVTGLDGAEVSYFRPPEPGLWALAYESTAAVSRLPAARFAAYLEHEGLDDVLRLRRLRGQESEPGVELYSRSLKSLAAIGVAAPAEGYGPLGLPLELVAEALPTAGAGGDVALRLLLRGEPLAGAQVDVRRLDRPRPQSVERARPQSSGRTDAEGRIRFRLGPGSWLAATVHMEAEASPAADWRSLFHTLTFAIPDQVAAADLAAAD